MKRDRRRAARARYGYVHISVAVVALAACFGCSSSSPIVAAAQTGTSSGGSGSVAASGMAAQSGGSSGTQSSGAAGGTSGGSIGSTGQDASAMSRPEASDVDAPDEGEAGPSTEGGDGVTDPGTQGDGNSTIMPPFMPSPDVSDQPGVAKGQIVSFTMANSTTFADGPRKVAVYVPAGYTSGTEVPFVVAQDGVTAQNGGSFGLDDLRPLLDNMIAAGTLPMMAGIFVDPGAMRSVEYDTVSDRYYQFVETELLPAAIAQVMMQTKLTLNLTSDPQGRSTFGGSSGGSAAFTMAWFHPESYTRVLTLSGSFVKLQSTTDYPDGAAEYHETLIPNTTPPKPIRVFLEAGTMDLGGGSWKTANDDMAMVLAAKNYHYRYVVADTATHEDDAARREYLPDAMAWLWRGYPITH